MHSHFFYTPPQEAAAPVRDLKCMYQANESLPNSWLFWTDGDLRNIISALGKKNCWREMGYFDNLLVYKSPFGLRWLSILIIQLRTKT